MPPPTMTTSASVSAVSGAWRTEVCVLDQIEAVLFIGRPGCTSYAKFDVAAGCLLWPPVGTLGCWCGHVRCSAARMQDIVTGAVTSGGPAAARALSPFPHTR